MQESKEDIKTRMLKNAARAWGYSETESETSFDPLVSMLLSACSAELEKISGEILNSRARVLERLVQLLSPDTLTGALPAHALACATPVEKQIQLKEDEQFYFTTKTLSIGDSDPVAKDIFFSPTETFTLNRASIRFMAAGNILYKITNNSNKEVLEQSENIKELPASSLWLGIDSPGVSLKNTQFYFDIRNESARSLFYNQLPNTNWYWNDQPLEHKAGFGDRQISGEQLELDSIVNREDDVSEKIRKLANAFYKDSFITLQDGQDLMISEDNGILSGMLAEIFTGKQAQLLKQQPLRWICIDFPQTISSRILQDVVCVMNCFPVFNRRLHEITYRLQEISSIVPLQTDDLFFDLEEVSNDEGAIFNTRSAQHNEDESISILLRNGGIGRFDERDASSIVSYLIQLLRDESVAFSVLGNDFMSSEMKQIQQLINKLEQRLFSSQLKQGGVPYLMIRNNSKSAWQNIFLRYWSTCGAEANNIKTGMVLRLYKGSSLEGNQMVLLTTTKGGRDKLNTTESVLAYKSALLSKDRIISSEDIKAFCHYQLRGRASKINIGKGVMVRPDQQQGFFKTIDVTIEILKKEYMEMMEKGEIDFWTDNLRLMLEDKSTAMFPYRIFIQQAV